jgi:prepilin-type N-terminal cleavage/methylation domain-containing protein
MMKLRTGQGGFTLIEAMLAVVVLAIAAAGVLIPFASGATVQADGIHRTIAAQLAGDLLEQIVSKPFSQVPGPLNDILDYNGYTETKGQIKDAAGNVLTDSAYANFSRGVSCAYVKVAQQQTNEDLSTDVSVFISVTVRVS